MWVKANRYQTGYNEALPLISDLTYNFSDGGMILDLRSNGIEFCYRSPGVSQVVATDPVFTTADNGNWHYVLATYAHPSTSSVVNIYLDGRLVKTAVEATPTMTYSNQTLYLGIGHDSRAIGGPYAREFGGIMDEVRIYSRALSAAEVENLYRSDAKTRTAAGDADWVLGSWHFYQKDAVTWLVDLIATRTNGCYEFRIDRWNPEIYDGRVKLAKGGLVSRLTFDADRNQLRGQQYHADTDTYYDEVVLTLEDRECLTLRGMSRHDNDGQTYRRNMVGAKPAENTKLRERGRHVGSGG